MKALCLPHHGTIRDVSFDDVLMPTIHPEEVLLEVRASSLNRLDLWVIKGWKGLKLIFPHILGSDGAGIVIEVGDYVQGYSKGDRVAVDPTSSCGKCKYCQLGQENMCDEFAVFGEHIPGFYAEYQTVPARNLVKIPDSVPFEIAAAASLVYVTAWHSLIEVGNFKAGEDILIIGAGGGVNTAYIDIAKFAGAKNIYVVGSTNRKLEVAEQLGANVLIDRASGNWGKIVYQASNRKGVDVVIDNVGALTFQQSLRSLKKGGRLLTVGNTSGAKFQLDNRYIFGKQLHIIGSTMGPHNQYEQVMDLIFEGLLHPQIDSVLPFAGALDALAKLYNGDVAGKIVLRHH